MPAVATAGGVPTRLGKYEILTALAAGGMARIYIARTTGIGSFERHVVLKLITPERERDVIAVQMFLDEARLAAALNHQNVAQVFEVGEDEGIHYLAMEFVHGQDLRSLLAKAGSQGTRVPLELALTTVAGAAAGLNHAHERRGPDGVPLGIVHRDVSPSNIMIGYDGSVKLLDFGIAKATARSVETQSGIIKGKFAYMAPEQCRGRDVDRRSDVFSLGIILYEVSTQHRCFRADSDFDTMHRIVTGDVVRPTRIVQGYPPPLEAIVMKALAVDPNQRFQSAGLLLEAIENYASQVRMSLSTMALGRFMREMFGDQPEPWLTATGRLAMLQPKESTVSNTAGGARAASDAAGTQSGRRASLPPTPAPLPTPDGPGASGAAALGAAATQLLPVATGASSTSLELPSASGTRDGRSDAAAHGDAGGDDEDDEDVADTEYRRPDAADWNAIPHSAMQPAFAPGAAVRGTSGHLAGAIALPRVATGPLARPSPPPHPMPVGTVPLPPSGSAPQQNPFALSASGSGSGSAPAHHPQQAYGHVPTASRAAVAYGVDGSDVRLRPNRRPLVIGGSIVAVALIAFLAVGGTGRRAVQPVTEPAPARNVEALAAPADAASASPAPVVAAPALDAAPSAATSAGPEPLPIPAVLPLPDAATPPPDAPPVTREPRTSPREPRPVTREPSAPARDPKAVPRDPKVVPRDGKPVVKKPPRCQPPGSANPFDSRPICK